MDHLSGRARTLLERQRFGVLATVNPDGTPHSRIDANLRSNHMLRDKREAYH